MMCRQYSEEEKQSYVEEFKRMDHSISVKGFAKGNDIPESTFRGWLKEDGDMAFGKIQINQPSTPTLAKPNKSTIVFACENIRIELKENFNKEFLKKIMEVLINV